MLNADDMMEAKEEKREIKNFKRTKTFVKLNSASTAESNVKATPVVPQHLTVFFKEIRKLNKDLQFVKTINNANDSKNAASDDDLNYYNHSDNGSFNIDNDNENYSYWPNIEGNYCPVSVWKHARNQKEVLIKYVKINKFKPMEPYVHSVMQHNKYFIKLYYSFTSVHGHLLIMDYIKEGDLFDYVKNNKICEKETRRILCQLVDAVHALHQEGIMHNDIKLENVLYKPHKQIYVCDYGLCKISNSAMQVDDYNHEPMIDGTIDYFSPEKIKGQAYAPHFDWWAVGVLTFELLTNLNHPFKKLKNEQINLKNLYKRQQEKISFCKPLSGNAESFVTNMLQFNINYRLIDYKKINMHKFLQNHKVFNYKDL
ncbi:pk1 [Lambdina fiscellaria nucleopolyhedrovirus]|uniref:Pk1 n=1 Tax=Lambdina fiscellaria nucleopolyhedrovirus TaxID=1642929 RepID=A0A0E3Z5Y6_9ABAC|nr:pk1 [Lambdina fiscellaria nucleopolyhedrovirus]AKC91628.1 pk1 [Lambdina fiscellaria nucleopolyhedrovirus]